MVGKKKLIVGNWKMNLTMHEASLLLHKLAAQIPVYPDVEVVLSPSLLTLQGLSLQIDHRQFKLAAQNLYWRDEGAFTGEISAHQLRGLVRYAIVGHSERRYVFGETNREVRNKIQAAVRNHLIPILCVGETASERATNETIGILHDQITAGLSNITSEDAKQLVVAYEPVWAVGTGDNALPRDVQIAAVTIRAQIKHMFGDTVAQKTRVLYGGSVTLDDVAAYLETPGVDGLLIGGASLDARVFSKMVEKAHSK